MSLTLSNHSLHFDTYFPVSEALDIFCEGFKVKQADCVTQHFFMKWQTLTEKYRQKGFNSIILKRKPGNSQTPLFESKFQHCISILFEEKIKLWAYVKCFKLKFHIRTFEFNSFKSFSTLWYMFSCLWSAWHFFAKGLKQKRQTE